MSLIDFLDAIGKRSDCELFQSFTVGPYDLFARLAHLTLDDTARPVDLFLLSLGEPSDPAATNIGCRPYLGSDVDWPVCSFNPSLPMDFLVQLNFTESRDLVPKLPGDILNVFMPGDGWFGDPDSFAYRWANLGDSPRHNVQPSEPNRFKAFGHRIRTWDIQKPTTIRPLSVGTIGGLKIGGYPWVSYITGESAAPYHGSFLGSVASVTPSSECPYPFVNVREPYSNKVFRTAESFMPYEWCVVNFYLIDGQVVGQFIDFENPLDPENGPVCSV